MVDTFSSAEAQKQAISSFQREADMLAQLSNEHIPRVFDRFSEGNHHFLVMEYIDGTTLEEQIKQHGGNYPLNGSSRSRYRRSIRLTISITCSRR